MYVQRGFDEALRASRAQKAEKRMNWSEALEFLKAGKSVTRDGWNGPGQFIAMQFPNELSKMTLPYIYIQTVQRDLVPWLASQTDQLAEDWRLI